MLTVSVQTGAGCAETQAGIRDGQLTLTAQFRGIGDQNTGSASLHDAHATILCVEGAAQTKTVIGIDNQGHRGHVGDLLGHADEIVDGEQLQIGDAGHGAGQVTAGNHDDLEAVHFGSLGSHAVGQLRNNTDFIIVEHRTQTVGGRHLCFRCQNIR